MGRGCGLPGSSGGGYSCRTSDVTSSGVSGRNPEGLSDAELAPGEGP